MLLSNCFVSFLMISADASMILIFLIQCRLTPFYSEIPARYLLLLRISLYFVRTVDAAFVNCSRGLTSFPQKNYFTLKLNDGCELRGFLPVCVGLVFLLSNFCNITYVDVFFSAVYMNVISNNHI